MQCLYASREGKKKTRRKDVVYPAKRGVSFSFPSATAAAGIHQTFCPIRFLLLLFNSSGWCWWWLILRGGEDRKEAETIYVEHTKFVIFIFLTDCV
jgi:hypothetical protein